MKSEAEKESDRQFWLLNGKTPDEEGKSSAKALGVLAIIAFGAPVAGVLIWLLTVHW